MLTKKDNIKNDAKGGKNPKTPSNEPHGNENHAHDNASHTNHSHDNHPQHSHEKHSHEHGGGCCQPVKAPNQQPAKTFNSQQPSKTHAQDTHQTDKKSSSKTKVTIKYDAGFPNQLYIRGKGANLSWDKGHPLKNVKQDEWTWETDAHFTNCEFKILINDRIYENGDNHQLHAGSSLLYTPHFY